MLPSTDVRRESIRLRATGGAIAVVGMALLIGGIGLVGILRQSLVSNLDRSAQQRADDLGSLVAARALPPSLAGIGEDTTIVQVVAADGTVLSATRNLQGKPALAFLTALGRSEIVTSASGRPVADLDSYRVAVHPVGQDVVYVGASLDPVSRTIDTVSLALLAGSPVLVILVAGLAWQVVGRALRPVELIRAEVADITAMALDRRVPVPAGQDEVARLATTMNDMLDRLENSRRRDRRFLSDASHELRSPLAALQTTVEVGLAHPLAADWPALAEIIHAESMRMQTLIDDLLVLARHDETAGRLPSTRWVDLDEVVMEQATALRSSVAPSIRFDLSRVSAGRILGDEAALRRVVRNLLDNAARHARSRIAVSLGTTDDPLRIRLTVEDDGAGIAEADREQVFERFRRLDEARSRDAGGSGLGLAIVREIVDAHGGSVWAEPGTKGGARLVMLFPTTPQADPASGRARAAPQEA